MSDIDIVIPTLNCATTLEWTLLSIDGLRREGVSFALIVVDSGSSDGTLEILERRGISSLFVPRGNMYVAVNHGLKLGNSQWCTYLNGDDVLYSSQFANSLKRNQLSKTDVIYANIDYIDQDGRFLRPWKSPPVKDLRALFEDGFNPIPQPGTIFSRRWYTQANGFCEDFRLSSDYDFFRRAANDNASFTREPHLVVAGFRLHGAQYSQCRVLEMRAEVIESVGRSSRTSSWLRRKTARARLRTINVATYVMRVLRAIQIGSSVVFPRCLSLVISKAERRK